MTERACRRRQ